MHSIYGRYALLIKHLINRNYAEQLVFFAVLSFAFGVFSCLARVYTGDNLFWLLFHVVIVLFVVPVWVVSAASFRGNYWEVMAAVCCCWIGIYCGAFLPDYVACPTERAREAAENIFIFGLLAYIGLFSVALFLQRIKQQPKPFTPSMK